MNYTYTIRKIDPQSQFMSVIYSREGYPDIFQNFNPTDFTRKNLIKLIEERSIEVKYIWDWIDNAPKSEIEDGEEGIGEIPEEILQEKVFVPPPEYNNLFEKIEESTETIDDVIYQKWTVIRLSDQEIINNVTMKFKNVMQGRLNQFARTREYDSIVSACTYVNSPIEKYASEAQRCIDLRSSTWEMGYRIINEINSGTRPIPTSMEEIESELPELTWED